jgi:uncharacterized protein YbjT (DUF2867 family)
MIVVTGALGNVGGAATDALLRRGAAVRIADVDVDAMADRYGTHLEMARLDFWDLGTFPNVLEGATGVFLVRPPAIWRVGPTLNRFIDVAARMGTEHIVFSSVAGADGNRTVPHHRVEQHLTASGLAWTLLRPGFFSQNIGTAYRDDIVTADRIFVPAADAKVAFVDTEDIGEIAARALSDADLRMRSFHLTGPEAITFADVAAMLSDVVGRRISYEPATALGYFRHLLSRDLAPPQAIVQTVLHVDLRRGGAAATTHTVEDLLGRPPRTVRQYLETNAARWRPDLG